MLLNILNSQIKSPFQTVIRRVVVDGVIRFLASAQYAFSPGGGKLDNVSCRPQGLRCIWLTAPWESGGAAIVHSQTYMSEMFHMASFKAMSRWVDS